MLNTEIEESKMPKMHCYPTLVTSFTGPLTAIDLNVFEVVKLVC